jgi:hypothetical protein
VNWWERKIEPRKPNTYDRYRDALQRIAAGESDPQSIARCALERKGGSPASAPSKVWSCLACGKPAKVRHKFCSPACLRLAAKGLCDAMPERAAQAKRRQKALKLRKQGLTYKEIGKRLGVGKAMASILVFKGEKDLEELSRPRQT